MLISFFTPSIYFFCFPLQSMHCGLCNGNKQCLLHQHKPIAKALALPLSPSTPPSKGKNVQLSFCFKFRPFSHRTDTSKFADVITIGLCTHWADFFFFFAMPKPCERLYKRLQLTDAD